MSASRPPADLGILLTLALRSFTDALHDRLTVEGFSDLRPPFGVIFRALAGEPMTLTALAAQLGVTKQSASKTVDEMEGKNLLYRRDSARDGRAKVLGLTERGRVAMATAIRLGGEIEAELSGAVGADGVQQLQRVLEAFVRSHGNGDDLDHRRSRAI